jgi:multisubunit Na+/H+ antiporter MnhB subunit
MAGPVGALTGGLIGAGVVTAHLLVNHPQATLEPGTALEFTLSEPLQMSPADVDKP